MKLEQLKALDAVVKAGSFAKAANEILLVTQPAVTRAVQNLEAELGFALFSREQYRPVLTPQGQAFYSRAQQILNQVENLSAFSQQMAQGMEPELKIAIDTYFLLPEMLCAFHETNLEFPCTQLHISCEILGGSIGKLLEKTCDLVIVPWTPDYYAQKGIVSQSLGLIRASTVVAKDFPLLQQKETVKAQDLEAYIQVVERTQAAYTRAAESSLNPHSQRWYVNDVHLKKQIILSGRSYGLLPYHLIESELASGQLVPFHNLEGFQVREFELRAVRLKDTPLGPVQAKLWQKLGQIQALRARLKPAERPNPTDAPPKTRANAP